VYSQFGTKADLFLALLECRMDERAAQTAARASGLSGDDGAVTLMAGSAEADHEDPGWGLLLIEFRVHAARDRELSARYAAAHKRTVERIAAVMVGIYQRASDAPPFPARQLAELMLALSSGGQLEHAANPAALPATVRYQALRRLLSTGAAGPAGGTGQSDTGRMP
jgi:AcrR family transcriptional regulator